MKQYILLAFATAVTLSATAQDNSKSTPSANVPAVVPGHKYVMMNNGEVITITDSTIGKTYTFSGYDTLHYAMVRKIMDERKAAKQQAQPNDKKREDVAR